MCSSHKAHTSGQLFYWSGGGHNSKVISWQ